MSDVVCVGDAMVDAFLTIQDASIHCRLNEKDCELCIRYGEKIPVETCCFLLGGIACNVSVGLSRLGLRSTLIAEIGDDEFSAKIIKGLKAERVDTDHIAQTPGASASFAIGINFKGERTLFVEHVKRAHEFAFDGLASQWIYLGGLGRQWKGAYERTLQFVEKQNAKLTFTPGSQQLAEGVDSFIEVLRSTHALFVNLQEAARIMNQESGIRGEGRNTGFVKESLKKIQTMGPRIVSITDGKNGSFAIDEQGKIYQMPLFPGDPIEKTGAGDAYTSGMVGALVLGLPVPEAMRFGAINAASVVARIGAQDGLLDRETIEVRLKRFPEFVATRI